MGNVNYDIYTYLYTHVYAYIYIYRTSPTVAQQPNGCRWVTLYGTSKADRAVDGLSIVHARLALHTRSAETRASGI